MTGNADHVHVWTESNPGRDAFRQRGRERVSGNQLTEGPLMKTRGEGLCGLQMKKECRATEERRSRDWGAK